MIANECNRFRFQLGDSQYTIGWNADINSNRSSNFG